MARLVYYQNERIEFKDSFDKKIESRDAVKIIIQKLLKHFKIGNFRIVFTSGRNHSSCNEYEITINMDYASFGVICHEVGHAWQFRNRTSDERDKNWHGKEHRKIMKRMVRYCEKKQWFASELERRTAPKQEKPAPSQDEIKMKEMLRIEQNIQKYEKKIKFYQKKLSKAKKSYNLRLSHLKKKQEVAQNGG